MCRPDVGTQKETHLQFMADTPANDDFAQESGPEEAAADDTSEMDLQGISQTSASHAHVYWR